MITFIKEDFSLYRILYYLFLYAIPIFYLIKIKEIRYEKKELVGIVLGIIGSFYDIRTLIYSSFIFFIILKRNRDLFSIKFVYFLFLLQIFFVLTDLIQFDKLYG